MMKVTCCDVAQVPKTHYDQWPVLFDCELAELKLPQGVSWEAVRGVYNKPGSAFVDDIEGSRAGEPPHFRYSVSLSPQDVGELLRNMPIEAVTEVIGGLLRNRDPRVIGAAVGEIIAHVIQQGKSDGRRADRDES
jgi:hypothetical protein